MRKKSRRVFIGLVLTLAALSGALFFYWQCLLDETVPLRRPIPATELNRAHFPSPDLPS